MVTHSDGRIPATSAAREKRSHECSNYGRQRKIQSSIISKVTSTCRCKRLRRGWQQLKAKRTTRSICFEGPRILKTYSASIPFRPAPSFRFANNWALSCWKRGNQKKHNENLRPRSRFIPDDSGVCTERRKPLSRVAITRMQTATTRNWPHKHQIGRASCRERVWRSLVG